MLAIVLHTREFMMYNKAKVISFYNPPLPIHVPLAKAARSLA